LLFPSTVIIPAAQYYASTVLNIYKQKPRYWAGLGWLIWI